MAEELKTQKGGRGEPPDDGRQWISIDDVAEKLSVEGSVARYHAKRQSWTTFRKHPYRTWILKRDFDQYLWFLRSKERWYKRRKPESWRPEVFEVDEETAKRIFCTVGQAALFMQVCTNTIHRWARQGKIPIFVTEKTGRGRRQWYSPCSLRMLRENVEHLKWRAVWKKAKETMRAGIVGRQADKIRRKPCVYRNPIPPGWLSTREVAERLDISTSSVRHLRKMRRFFARQYIKGKLQDTEYWMTPELIRNRHWFFDEETIEAFKNSEEYQTMRQRGKNNVMRQIHRMG